MLWLAHRFIEHHWAAEGRTGGVEEDASATGCYQCGRQTDGRVAIVSFEHAAVTSTGKRRERRSLDRRAASMLAPVSGRVRSGQHECGR